MTPVPLTQAAALTETLREQRIHYLDMIDLAEAEADAIASADVALLTTVVGEKELIVAHLAALEADRLTEVVAIADALGIAPDGVVLTDLAARLLPDESQPLLEAGVALKQAAEQAQALNERNRGLLQDSSRLVDQWMQYLRAAMATANSLGTGYGQDGDHSADASPRMLDRSA